MNNDTVKNVLREDAESNRPREVDLWPGVRSRLLHAEQDLKARQTSEHGVRRNRGITSRRAAAMYAGMLLALFAIAALAWSLFLGAKPVSATQVLSMANQASQNPDAYGLRSFEGVFTQVFTGPGTEGEDTASTENHIWYQAPNKERIETRTKSNKLITSIHDGKWGWSYDTEANIVRLFDPTASWRTYSSMDGEELQDLLKNTSEGYEVQMLDHEQVAGRPTYVLQLTPKVQTSIALASMPNAKRLWVDRATYMILKYEEHDDDFNLGRSWTYTSFKLNPHLDPSLFTFTVPEGAQIIDMLGDEGPTGRQVREQWQAVARHVNFPLFMFVSLPDSFVSVEGPAQDSHNPNKIVQRFRWLPDEEDTVVLIEEAGPLVVSEGLGERVVIGDFVGYLKREGDTKTLTWEEQGTVITLVGRVGIDERVLVDFPEQLERVRP